MAKQTKAAPQVDQRRRDRIIAAINSLRDANGRISAEVVVTAARNPKHPLHSEFEWDVDKAAMHAWLERARVLIKYVTVTVISHTQTITVPYYVRDPSKDGDEGGMIAVDSSVINRKHAEQVLLSELTRCRSSIERARGICATLDKRHRGISEQLETMLRQLVLMEDELAA